MDSHSDGSLFEDTIVEGLAVAFDDQFVEVVGVGGVEGSQGEVIEDEDVDAGQAAHLGVEGCPGGRRVVDSSRPPVLLVPTGGSPIAMGAEDDA
jgi:hypothetical protein